MTEINTSADFGEFWLVQVTYATTPDGELAADHSNRTLHGPFDNKADADRWAAARLSGDDPDLDFVEVINANRVAPPATSPEEDAYADLARSQWAEDGKIEFDEHPKVSEGDDPGAYVQAWVWVARPDDPEFGGRTVCGLCGTRYAAEGHTACNHCA